MSKLALLVTETAHLSTADKHAVAWLLGQAVAMVEATPGATVEALETKLLTLYDGERWVRQLVAKAAMEAAGQGAAAIPAELRA